MNALTPFNYAALGPEQSAQAREAAERIRVRMSRTVQDIIEIGRDLIAVKERIGHGNFLPWIEAEFGMAERTARNFMSVSERYGSKSAMVADLPVSALYELAAPSTPEPVREEVERRAADGERVSADEVRKLKDKYKELKAQKDAVESYKDRLLEETMAKDADIRRLHDLLNDAKEEARRAAEPNTITVERPSPVSGGIAERAIAARQMSNASVDVEVEIALAVFDHLSSPAQAEFRRRIA